MRWRLGHISFGYLLILLGVLWMLNPSLPGDLIKFFREFRLERVDGDIYLPALGQPSSYIGLLTASMQFCLAYGAFQGFILVLRFIKDDPLSRKAGTVSAIAFWLTMGFFFHLMVNGAIKWFGLIAGFIISIGLTITVNNMIKLLSRRLNGWRTDDRRRS